MSPRNLVPDLSNLCVRLVSTNLIQVLADDETDNFELVANYLSETTYEVVQDLLKNILNSENLDASTRFSCLQVLLRHDVKKLDTGIFPHSYYDGILKVISEQGVGLQYLNLRGVWARDHPVLLSELIKRLKKLRVLVIPHMVDDSILEAITSCKCLKVLDISGECSFTAQALKLLKNETITVLEIGNFGKKDVCSDDVDELSDSNPVTMLLENLPNLTYLRIYSFTGSALVELQKLKIGRTTKLKYLHDTGTNREIMDAITELCPNLESIHIDSPEVGVIAEFKHLKKLNSLKLTRPINDELVNFINNFGDRLQTLTLNHNKTTSFDLSTLCLDATNLLTLECFQMKLTYSQDDTYFMSLQNVEILYCDINDSCLRFLLLNAPFLRRIVIGCVINMTDGDIFRLCAECDFECLEELWFSCARGLTVTSVELLMGHCPNLKVIGQLSGWDIHQEEVDYLRSVIIYTNTDLTLLPLGTI